MNPDKLSNYTTPETESVSQTEKIATAQLESVENQRHGRQFESDSLKLSRALKQAVETIPEGTPQRAEADNILSGFKRIVGKNIRTLIAALSLMSPLTSLAQDTTTDNNKHQEAVEMIPQKQYSEAVKGSLEDLRVRVWNDDFETSTILFGKPGLEELLTSIHTEPQSTQIEHSLKQRREILNNMERIYFSNLQTEHEHLRDVYGDVTPPNNNSYLKDFRTINQHNHPVQLLVNMNRLDVATANRMKAGEVAPVVIPPSVVDLFAEQLARVDNINHLAEPSGTWTFYIDYSHPVAQIVKRETLKEEARMNNGEARVVKEGGAIYYAGSQLPYIEREVQEQFNISYETTIFNMIKIAESIWEESAAGRNVSNLVELYITMAASLGVHVEYQPNQAIIQ